MVARKACRHHRPDTPERHWRVDAYLDSLRRIREPTDEGHFGGAMDHAKLNPILRWMAARDCYSSIQEAGMKLSTYLLGAGIVWTAIFLATAVVLRGTPFFAQVLPVLAGGAVWFVVLVPSAWSRRGRGRPS